AGHRRSRQAAEEPEARDRVMERRVDRQEAAEAGAPIVAKEELHPPARRERQTRTEDAFFLERGRRERRLAPEALVRERIGEEEADAQATPVRYRDADLGVVRLLRRCARALE